MRRRLFWTIALTALAVGAVVMAGILISTRRVSEAATKRELTRSSQEIVAIVEDSLTGNRRSEAGRDILRLLEGDLGVAFGRVRRAAGGSELGFAVVTRDGEVVTNNEMFGRIDIDPDDLAHDQTSFASSEQDGLVALTPLQLGGQPQSPTLVVGLARETPVLGVSDFGPWWLWLGMISIAMAALLARLLSAQLVARLSPLTDATKRLAAGDGDVRVPELGDPDLDGVGTAFNEMASEIQVTREREREFLLGVGHDLRTPLTTIAGYAEALEAGGLESDEVERIGGILGVQSRQLGRLIEDLTLLARLEQPEFTVRWEEVDVGSHVAEVVAGFRQRAEILGVALEADTQAGLIVRTDPDRLAQIARNLIENALRFTPGAGSIGVGVTKVGGEVEMSVADTGIGIDPDDIPHIFERHYVGRRQGVRREGTGLGLSIVAGLVERLGGRVSAESAPGVSTVIRVMLPLPGEG